MKKEPTHYRLVTLHKDNPNELYYNWWWRMSGGGCAEHIEQRILIGELYDIETIHYSDIPFDTPFED